MNDHHVRELGEGNIAKLILRYSMPTMVATVVNASYNIVDRIFVGRTCGEDAIAAITVCFAPTLILLAVGMTIGVGSGTIISISLGKKNFDEAEKILGQAFFMFFAFWICVAAYMYKFMPQTLMFLGATERILPDATAYYSIIISGLIFEKISFGINGLVRAEGRPVYAMATILIGGVVNVVLDYVFLVEWGMGVRGAALATVIAQACGTVWVLVFYMGGKSFLKIRLKNLRIHLDSARSVLSAGSPSFVIQFLTGISIMVFVQQAREYGSESALSIIGVNSAVVTFMFLPIVGISMGVQPILGYNWGMGNFHRVKSAFITAIFAGSLIALAGWAACMLFAGEIFEIFLGSASPLLDSGERALRIVTVAFPFIALNIITSGFFQSTKRPVFSILITTMRQAVLLIPLLFVLPKYFGLDGIWASYPVSDFLAFLFSLLIALREIRLLRHDSKPAQNIKWDGTFPLAESAIEPNAAPACEPEYYPEVRPSADDSKHS